MPRKTTSELEFDDADEVFQPDPVPLFEVESTNGPAWSFELSTVDIDQGDLCDHDGNPVRGMCLIQKRRCLINADEPRWSQDEATMHELMHALLINHGMTWFSDKREEALVGYLSPRLYDALHKLGFRWPKRPKAADALCRQAIIDSS